MKSSKANFSTPSYLCAFIIGVILFWSFGKHWLDLTLTLVFLAGLIVLFAYRQRKKRQQLITKP